jgi:hypothetical protein
MKLKKTLSFTDKNQIWRLLISDDDKLIIETRNTSDKEVFYHCYNLEKGKKIFSKLQLEEKFWIGIEAVKNDIIYFHHYAKPNMPEHKKIIAYSIDQEKVIWINNDLIFLTLNDDKIFAFKKKFEGQDLYVLNAKNGEMEDNLGNNPQLLTQILHDSQQNEDFSNYKYPEQNQNFSEEINSLISLEIDKNNIENFEALITNNLLCFNYYKKSENNLLDNVFVVYNIEKRKKVISEIINKNLNSFSPDSFFTYKNYLFVLKNKNEIVTYKF